jgi:hypothetical protein
LHAEGWGVVFCKSLFGLLYFFFCPLCCLSFFNLRLLIPPLLNNQPVIIIWIPDLTLRYRYRTYFLQNERLLVVRQESSTQLAISTELKWLPVRLRILPSFRMQENLQHSELLVSKNLSGVKVGHKDVSTKYGTMNLAPISMQR